MKARSGKILAVTHGAGLLAGIALAVISLSGGGKRTHGSTAEGHGPRQSVPGIAGTKERPRPAVDTAGMPALLTTREYQQAWDAIAWRKLTVDGRVALQKEVLRQWSLVDLHGAMLAALDGNWWIDPKDNGGGTLLLLDAFDEAFTRNPEEAWDMLQTPELRLASGVFLGTWSNVFSTQPELLPRLAPRMSMEDVQARIGDVARSPALDDPAKKAAFLSGLASCRNERDALQLLVEAHCLMQDGEEVSAITVEQVTGAATEKERAMALGEYLSTLPYESRKDTSEAFAKLPDDLRAAALDALFNSERLYLNSRSVLDIALAEGRTDLLAEPEAIAALRDANGLEEMFGDDQLIDWALSLPEVPEAETAFRTVVSSWVNGQLSPNMGVLPPLTEGDAPAKRGPIGMDQSRQQAKDWVESIPPGRHRQLALEVMIEKATELHEEETAAWARERLGR